MRPSSLFILLVVVIAIMGLGYFWLQRYQSEPEGVYCTQDAKLCPDGSYVGRQPPSCQFAACPKGSGNSTSTNTEENPDDQDNFTVNHPESLGTKYITPTDWPPEVEVQIAQFLCAEPLKKINGRDYCIGTTTEGAAGNVYTTYTYNTVKDERMVTVKLSLRSAQCANYSDPEKTECEKEQKEFKVDDFVDQIVSGVEFR